jgi:hypothetical protein
MGKNLSRISGLSGFLAGLLAAAGSAASSPLSTCPSDLKSLSDRLLQDLPSYTNRVIQRSRSVVDGDRSLYIPLYVIIAGRAEFQPLPLRTFSRGVTPPLPETTEQLFFTTLEHQYNKTGRVTLQNFHWLFLTRTVEGWKLVTLYTQLASPGPEEPPLPPLETSSGTIGQAIRIWLRDCEAGTLRGREPLSPATNHR